MKKRRVLVVGMLAAAVIGVVTHSVSVAGQVKASPDSRLAVIWSSGDPEVAHCVCPMYTHNAKKQKWFSEVTLIVWGPSARLLAADKVNL